MDLSPNSHDEGWIWVRKFGSSHWVLTRAFVLNNDKAVVEILQLRRLLELRKSMTCSKILLMNESVPAISEIEAKAEINRDRLWFQIFSGEIQVASLKPEDKIFPFSLAQLSDTHDADQIDLLNESILAQLLLRRYMCGQHFTAMRDILLCVNVRETLGKKEKVESTALRNFVDRCFQVFEKNLKNRRNNLAIIIRGGTGSGKTTETRQLLRLFIRKGYEKSGSEKERRTRRVNGYMKQVGGFPKRSNVHSKLFRNRNPMKLSRKHGQKEELELSFEAVMDILELFTQAPKSNNLYSSRGCSFHKLHFDRSGQLVGASTNFFLLEGNRIAAKLKNKEMFNVFYLLRQELNRSDSSLRIQFGELLCVGESGICPEEGFNYLNQCTKGSHLQNETDTKFQNLSSSFSILDLDNEAQIEIFKILLAILFLGNIEFVGVSGKESGQQESTVDGSNPFVLQCLQKLIGMNQSELVQCLCFRTVKAGRRQSFTLVPLSLHEAEQSRDGLSRALYRALVAWICAHASSIMQPLGEKNSYRCIGIVDCLGTDDDIETDLGGLLANYADEKLQHMFRTQMHSIYVSDFEEDEITIPKELSISSCSVLEILEDKKSGLLRLLNDTASYASALPFDPAKSFLDSLLASSVVKRQSPALTSDPLKIRSLRFVVQHHSKTVTYNCKGFVSQNLNLLQADVADLLAFSQNNRFLSNLFSKSQSYKSTSREGFIQVQESSSRSKATTSDITLTNIATRDRKFAMLGTVSSVFQCELLSLCEQIEECDKYFAFTFELSSEKVRRNGVISKGSLLEMNLINIGVSEIVRIRHNSYPTRMSHSEFQRKYQVVVAKFSKMKILPGINDKAVCEATLLALLCQDWWTLGNSLCLLKGPSIPILDTISSGINNSSASRIQIAYRIFRRKQAALKSTKADAICSWYKGTKQRIVFSRQRRAVTTISAWRRCIVHRRKYRETIKKVLMLQSFCRLATTQTIYKKKRQACTKIASVVRMYFGRKEFLNRLQALQVESATVVQRFWRTQRTRRAFMALRLKVSKVTALVKGAVTRWKFSRMLSGRLPWRQFLATNEAVLHTSLVAASKSTLIVPKAIQKQLSRKKKIQLILTTAPYCRLLVIDPSRMQIKEEVKNIMENVSIFVDSVSDFTIAYKRENDLEWKYEHYRDVLGPAMTWVTSPVPPYSVSTLLLNTTIHDKLRCRVEVYISNPEGSFTFKSINLGSVFGGPANLNPKRKWVVRWVECFQNRLLWYDNATGKVAVGGIFSPDGCIVYEHSQLMEEDSTFSFLELKIPVLQTQNKRLYIRSKDTRDLQRIKNLFQNNAEDNK